MFRFDPNNVHSGIDRSVNVHVKLIPDEKCLGRKNAEPFEGPIEDDPAGFSPADVDGDDHTFKGGSNSEPVQGRMQGGRIVKIRDHGPAEARACPVQNFERFRPYFEGLLKLIHVGDGQTVENLGWDLVGLVSQDAQQEPESFLASNLPMLRPPNFADLSKTLRESVIENVKIQFAEMLGVDFVDRRGSCPDRRSVHLASRQPVTIDMHHRVECIENERAIIHGSIVGIGFSQSVLAKADSRRLKAAPTEYPNLQGV